MSSSQDKISRQTSHDKTFQWQFRLLPFMIIILGGLSCLFFYQTLKQFNRIQSQNEQVSKLDITTAFSGLEDKAFSESNRLVYVQWKTLALLEKNVLERRYHQANILLMARTWTQYLGFLTGMILALVGAAFILGKLREESSDFQARNAEAEISFKSTSPGLILAFLGTILMLATIFSHKEIVVNDAPIYTNFYFLPGSNKKAPPPQPLLPEFPNGKDPIDERNKNKF